MPYLQSYSLSMILPSHIHAYTTTFSVSLNFHRLVLPLFITVLALKAPSHLVTLSISHALAQSTLLAAYESKAQTNLSSPETSSIPKQLALNGSLSLRRRDALKITGRLFKLRTDVNLVSNVLDTPELFWSEASLKELYDACRDYFEIAPRVQVLNERLGVASDLVSSFRVALVSLEGGSCFV